MKVTFFYFFCFLSLVAIGVLFSLKEVAILSFLSLIFFFFLDLLFSKLKIEKEIPLLILNFIFVLGIVAGVIFDFKEWDIIGHFLGGIFCVVLAKRIFKIKDQREKIKFFFYLGIASLLFILWEFLEFFLDQINLYFVFQSSLEDTMQDFICDMVGAIFWLIWKKF
mgnify:CR=1 FL=1